MLSTPILYALYTPILYVLFALYTLYSYTLYSMCSMLSVLYTLYSILLYSMSSMLSILYTLYSILLYSMCSMLSILYVLHALYTPCSRTKMERRRPLALEAPTASPGSGGGGRLRVYLNFVLSLLTSPTSRSPALKSVESTEDRQEIHSWGRRGLVVLLCLSGIYPSET